MRNLIIASTSTVYGGSYLAYLKEEVKELFAGCKNIIFIPYARPGGISHDAYTAKVNDVFSGMNLAVTGLHTYEDPAKALQNADGIFTGGGNTFVLVKTLWDNQLMTVLKEVILNGTPYLGTSAGSNITGISMKTTNDMPIMYPSDFTTLGIIPFNLNPHYLDPTPNSTHMGETRETRINEFHSCNTTPVIGLREGSWLEVRGENCILRGSLTARLFQQNAAAVEIESGTDFNKMTF